MKILELDNTKNFHGWFSRESAITNVKQAKEDGSYPAVVTTEQPAIVADWERWELVREVLLMSGAVVPGNKQVPLLDAHSRFSTSTIKGSIRNLRAEGQDLVGDVYFWSGAKDEISKVSEGHLTDLSAGYRTFDEFTVEIKPGKEELVNGTLYKNDYGDNKTLLIRTRWEVKEGSLVPIGADNAAKFKSEIQEKITSEDPELQKTLNEIINNQKSLTEKINSIKGGSEMADTKKDERTPEQIRLDLINDIDGAAEQFGEPGQKLAVDFRKQIREGKEVDIKDFYKAATDLIMKRGGVNNKPVTHLGLNKSELDEFSPARAVQNILMGKRSGLEFDINQELEKKTGLSSSERSILIPADYQNVGLRELINFNTRAHSTTATQGGDLITDAFQGNLLKEVIRNQTVLGQAGITIITGLRADKFQLPKITTGLTIYPVAENIAATTSYVVTGLEEVGSKRLSGNTEYGRELFFKTDGSLAGFDQILMKDLYQALDVQVDYEGINGTGLSNRPTGILNQSNILAPSLATLDLTHIVNVIRKVAKQNGLKDNMKWLNSVDVQCSLRKTPVFPTGHTDRTLYENGMIEGYQSISSNQVPDAVNILGLWPEFYMLNWGVEELIVADQPKHKEWMVEISLHRLVNFFLRSPESFAISDDVPVAEWDDLDA